MPKPSRTGVRGLYKDADGRYRIDLRYRDTTGREQRYKERIPEGTPGGAARSHAQDVLARALAGTLRTHDEAGEVPATLADAFKRYLEWCKVNGRAGSDPKYKERHRDRILETLKGDMLLADVSELAIERHKKARREAGKEPGTINRELVTLKHFLNRCVDWGWITKRPKIALLKEPPGRVRWLTDAERAKLGVELAKPQRVAFRRVVTAALLSGQRLSNLITLTRADVDLQHRTLTIPKTKPGKRHHVPISDALADVLTEALAASKCDFVFVPQRGNAKRPYTRSGVSTFFARLAGDAGLTDFRFHDLRHDFATAVRRNGHGLDVVQALLGHATPTMTQRYAHLGREALAVAVNVAPGLPPAPELPARKPKKKAAKKVRRTAS